MDRYQTRAYAKINLGLDVVKRLPNGYHQVKMVMQNIGIHDELTFEKAEQAVTIFTDSEELPTDENNLIYKAARYMLDKYSVPSGLRVHLSKNIPIAAGLAGGSTDAAATIKGSPDRIPVGDGPTNRLPPSTVNSAAWDIMTLTALCANTAGKMLPVRRHR